MNYPASSFLFVMNFIIGIANARFYHVNIPQDFDNYPITYHSAGVNDEQASRDLDLTFSAGDPSELNDLNNIIYPSSKNYISTMVPVVDFNHDNDRPKYWYKWPAKIPTGRLVYDGDSSIYEAKKSRNLMRVNNGEKNEVIFEIRVVANVG